MEYISTNFMLYVRGNFKNVTIYTCIFGNTFTFCTDIPFAVHLNCVEKKSYIYVKNFNSWQFFFYDFLKSKIRIFIIFYDFHKHWCSNFSLNPLLTSFPSEKLFNLYNPCPPRIWVVLLHHYIHACKIICFINTQNNINTHLTILYHTLTCTCTVDLYS